MNMQPIKRYVCLENRKRELDTELKLITKQLIDIEREVVQEFLNDGVDKITADGRTLKIVPEVFASPVEDRWAVVEALKKAGLDQYIPQNYNDAQLRSFVKDIAGEILSQAENEDRIVTADDIRTALPAPLGQALNVYLGHKLSSRKA
jgi:hypothetical protein